MLIPAGLDIALGNPDWQIFASAASAVGVISLLAIVATRRAMPPFSLRFGFILVNSIWVMTSLVAALPMAFSEQSMSVTDAVFESVSGITTTGSTVLAGLDAMPPGFLLWRSMIQWFGGLGIIAMGLLLLPFLKVGGMQIYRMESSLKSENPYTRFSAFSRALLGLYLLISVLCALAYALAGMSPFDAINHAMTTVSTGGYSTHDASMGAFGREILLIGIVFMGLGAMPFVALLRAAQSRSAAQAGDPQILVLVAIFFALALPVAFSLVITDAMGMSDAVVHSMFNIVSVVTTTGYASMDYNLWGPFAVSVFMLAMFLGGAAGSTSGGIKTYRLIIMYQSLRTALSELVYPNGVFTVRYGGDKISENMVKSVALFVVAFLGLLLLLTMALGSTGLDLLTAYSGALTALTNVGPGLGDTIGPAGNFSTLPDMSKWILIVGMLLGRLEIMTMLVLFSPTFWNR
jgi:trk system potassium uptake protein TrkH